MIQFTPLEKGEEILVMHTNMGDIKFRLFPDEAPLAVENFVTHAKNGYYDGVIFHRIIPEFMVQGGDPEGTGMGGESIWGSGFGYEKSENLRHFRGALAMAHSQLPDSNGSQFYIVQSKDVNPDQPFDRAKDGTIRTVKDVLSKKVLDAYVENGGTPHLDLAINPEGHTVFGHVVAGMDVVDAIAEVSTDNMDKPITDVLIESITFEVYE